MSIAKVIDDLRAQVAAKVEVERRVEPGDVEAAVRVVVAHYEQRGDGVLLLLAQEGSEPLLTAKT